MPRLDGSHSGLHLDSCSLACVKLYLPQVRSSPASRCICLISIPTMVVLQTFSTPSLLWIPVCEQAPYGWMCIHSQLSWRWHRECGWLILWDGFGQFLHLYQSLPTFPPDSLPVPVGCYNSNSFKVHDNLLLVFPRLVGTVCMLHNKMYNGLEVQKIVIAILCLLMVWPLLAPLIAALTTSACCSWSCW